MDILQNKSPFNVETFGHFGYIFAAAKVSKFVFLCPFS